MSLEPLNAFANESRVLGDAILLDDRVRSQLPDDEVWVKRQHVAE